VGVFTHRQKGKWMKRRKAQKFEVLPAGEMRKKYGLTAENRPIIKLDPAKVPEPLRHLIPLAERFGISDDLIREDYMDKTPVVGLTPRLEIGPAVDLTSGHDDDLPTAIDQWRLVARFLLEARSAVIAKPERVLPLWLVLHNETNRPIRLAYV
jgi:hypothetical protein